MINLSTDLGFIQFLGCSAITVCSLFVMYKVQLEHNKQIMEEYIQQLNYRLDRVVSYNEKFDNVFNTIPKKQIKKINITFRLIK